MKIVQMSVALMAVLASLAGAGLAMAEERRPDVHAADKLFQAGKFGDAEAIYARVAARDPKDYAAAIGLGRIALLANRLDEARNWLGLAIALRPGESGAKIMLAAALYRQDDFQKAATALAGIDVAHSQLIISQYPTLNVAKLESFKGQTPYEITGAGDFTRLPFLKTDPLPLVSVRINGGAPVTFFIDTGGSEVTLDSQFAQELGLPRFGKVQGTFSGGQHTDVEMGRINSLTAGDWTIRNLPVAILPLRQLSSGFGVKRIDGILGTTLFYHFLATMDYPNAQLVLRRKTGRAIDQLAPAASSKPVEVPFWIASDHFMVGWGRVETLPPTLLFVDSGLAGAGVKLAGPVIKDAGIKLEEDKAYQGAGGGGALKIVPYTVRRLSFGAAEQDNVPGLYDGPFPWEDAFGFHLAGMVGHDFFKRYAVTLDFEDMKIVLQ